MKKRLSLTAAVLAAVMALTGGSESILTSSNAKDDTTSSIWTANDDDIVGWATAENLTDAEKEYYNIPFKEFYREYSFNIANMGIDETNEAYASYAQTYRQNIINMLANERIILKKAEELGFDVLSDEDMAQIEKDCQENLNEWYSHFSANAKNELGLGTTSGGESSSTLTEDEEAQILAKSKELFNEYIAEFGLTEENFLVWEKNAFVEKKTLEDVYKDITVTDAEVDKHISDLIEKAKAAYEKDVYSFESSGDYTSVWMPEGTRQIKHIFIGINSSDAAEITAARNESGADDAEIDKLRDEKLAEIKDKIDAAYEKATAEGADFDAVLKEYSNDYNSSVEDQTITIVKGTKMLSEDLYDAIYGISEVGGISEIIPTDTGYYFFLYTGDKVITDLDLKTKHDSVYTELLDSRRNEAANKALDEWSTTVGYEFDYEKLNIEISTDEETSSANEEASSADEEASE